MPLGRYPGVAKAFKKWASGKLDDSKISDSATPSKASKRATKGGRRTRRGRRKPRKTD